MIRNLIPMLLGVVIAASAPALAGDPSDAGPEVEIVEDHTDETLPPAEKPEATPGEVLVVAPPAGPSGSTVLGGLWGALLVGFVVPAVLLLVDAFAKAYLPQPKWLVAGGSGALGGVIVGLATGGGFFGVALGVSGAVMSWFACDWLIKQVGSDA